MNRLGIRELESQASGSELGSGADVKEIWKIKLIRLGVIHWI